MKPFFQACIILSDFYDTIWGHSTVVKQQQQQQHWIWIVWNSVLTLTVNGSMDFAV